MRTLSQKSHKSRTTCTFSGSAAIALLWCCASFWLSSPAIASDDSATISAIHTDTTSIKLDVEEIRDFLDYSNGAFVLRGTENKLDSVITQTTATQQKLQSILSFLNYNAGAGSTDNVRYYLQQLLAQERQSASLASNPWWSTNSAFALTRAGFLDAFPKRFPPFDDGLPGIEDLIGSGMSFPEFMSMQSLLHVRGNSDLHASSPVGPLFANMEWTFGADAFTNYANAWNYSKGAAWTFDDWLATWLRENGSRMFYADSTNELASWSASTGASSTLGEVPRTNALEDLAITQPNNSVVASALSGVFQDGPNIDDVLPSMSSASPEIVILDAGTNAGHAVPRVAATLDNSVVSWIRIVASWAWRLAGVVALWIILRTEYGYWTTLGQGGAE